MASPKPSLRPPPPGYDETSAIGEVTVLVYALKTGRSEVRVRYPTNALPGQPGARAKQDQFHSLVLDELQKSLNKFRQHP